MCVCVCVLLRTVIVEIRVSSIALPLAPARVRHESDRGVAMVTDVCVRLTSGSCLIPQALALIELYNAPEGRYKQDVYLLPKKMGKRPCSMSTQTHTQTYSFIPPLSSVSHTRALILIRSGLSLSSQ